MWGSRSSATVFETFVYTLTCWHYMIDAVMNLRSSLCCACTCTAAYSFPGPVAHVQNSLCIPFMQQKLHLTRFLDSRFRV